MKDKNRMLTNLIGGHKVEVQDTPLADSGVHKHEGVLVQVHGRQQSLALLALASALAGRLDFVYHQLTQVAQDANRPCAKLPWLLGANAPVQAYTSQREIAGKKCTYTGMDS